MPTGRDPAIRPLRFVNPLGCRVLGRASKKTRGPARRVGPRRCLEVEHGVYQNVIFTASCMIRSPAVAVGRPKSEFLVNVVPATL